MKLLTVDIGNSRAKADVWEGSEHLCHAVVDSSEIAALDHLVEFYEVEDAMLISVGANSGLWEKCLEEKLSGNVISGLPEFIDNYEVRYTSGLGVDRAAAFIGAASLFPDTPLLIVDAGTALTVDVVDKNGIFCGGNISLGLYSRLKAINLMTAKLPMVTLNNSVKDFGNDTEEAIRNGAINGVVAELLYDFKNAEEVYGIEKLVITGGDAPYLIPLLKDKGLECHHDPYLVGRGMNVEYRRMQKSSMRFDLRYEEN